MRITGICLGDKPHIVLYLLFPLSSQEARTLRQKRLKFIGETYDFFMDGGDYLGDHIARHEDEIKQLVHGSRGGAASLKAELEHLKRKREAIEAEPDPVAEIQKHLIMVEEDKEKLQKYLMEKKAYSEKLHLMVSCGMKVEL